MVTTMETVLDTVKISLGFSQAEADHYLTIHEEAGLVVVKLRAKSYMEPTTWNAFIALMKQLGAVHEKENSPTFQIPIRTEHVHESAPVETKTEDETNYSLAVSRESLGELYPVLVDAHGNVIDGNHRLGENPNWHEEVRPQIDTPDKLALAQIACNDCRRIVSPAERKQRIEFLAKDCNYTAQMIHKGSGLSLTTIYKYMPQELKNQKLSEGIRKARESRQEEENKSTLAELDKRKGSGEHDQLIDALDTASYPSCPICLQEPDHVSSQGLPWAVCLRGHEWNIKTGTAHSHATPAVPAASALTLTLTGSYLDSLVECSGCHLMILKNHVENGKCQDCRSKETQVAVDKEIREAIGQTEAPVKVAPIPNLPGLKATLEEEIVFLIIPPAIGEHSIPLTKEKLETLFTAGKYAESGLTKITVTQTSAGITASFNLVEWLKYNSAYGAPSGSMNSELFEAELKSLLCKDPNFDPDEVDQLTVKQLKPAAEPEQKTKTVKEIDWNAQGRNCPCCGLTISLEKYLRLKEKFSKYQGLFVE
jgi:hypothetical protein